MHIFSSGKERTGSSFVSFKAYDNIQRQCEKKTKTNKQKSNNQINQQTNMQAEG